MTEVHIVKNRNAPFWIMVTFKLMEFVCIHAGLPPGRKNKTKTSYKQLSSLGREQYLTESVPRVAGSTRS